MVKQTKNTTKRIRLDFTQVIALAAFFLSVISLFSVWVVRQEFISWTDASFQNQIRQIKTQDRLEFCFNNNIRPCDDISLRKFNEQPKNKDNLFPL